jgi:ubiquinone/menaquinone biosynthesis C-methylase UbiE
MPVPVLKVDITNIPFEDSVFDVILCNHVLEHIPDDLNAMAELYRVLKSGGWGIFQVPLDNRNNSTYEDFSITTPEARQKAFGQKDHVRIYGKDYPDRLRKVGFDVKTNDFALKMSAEERFEYGLKKQLIYYCEKN